MPNLSVKVNAKDQITIPLVKTLLTNGKRLSKLQDLIDVIISDDFAE